MATLTAADYGALRRAVYRVGFGKDELKALPVLPKQSELLAAFQAIETTMTTNFPALKTATETALGQPLSTLLMTRFFEAWVEWKLANRS